VDGAAVDAVLEEEDLDAPVFLLGDLIARRTARWNSPQPCVCRTVLAAASCRRSACIGDQRLARPLAAWPSSLRPFDRWNRLTASLESDGLPVMGPWWKPSSFNMCWSSMVPSAPSRSAPVVLHPSVDVVPQVGSDRVRALDREGQVVLGRAHGVGVADHQHLHPGMLIVEAPQAADAASDRGSKNVLSYRRGGRSSGPGTRARESGRSAPSRGDVDAADVVGCWFSHLLVRGDCAGRSRPRREDELPLPRGRHRHPYPTFRVRPPACSGEPCCTSRKKKSGFGLPIGSTTLTSIRWPATGSGPRATARPATVAAVALLLRRRRHCLGRDGLAMRTAPNFTR